MIVVAVLAVAGLIYYLSKQKNEIAVVDCRPAEVERLTSRDDALPRAPERLRIIVDASGGMKGYAAAGTRNVLGNLVTVARNFPASSYYSESEPGQVEFYSFGEYRFRPNAPVAPPRVGDPDEFGRPNIYGEPESRIADVLRWIGSQNDRGGRQTLSVVVTDLMLDDREAADDPEASVGGLLRNMEIKQGVSVGLLGVRVPFAGPIYWNNATHAANLPDRPLMLILIGDPRHVRGFYDYLRTTGVRPFSHDTPASAHAFALFGLEASEIADGTVELTGSGGGFLAARGRPGSGLDRFPAYSIDLARLNEESADGIEVKLKADANVVPYEVTGDSPLYQGTIWRLNDDPPTAPPAPTAGASPGQCQPDDVWTLQGSLPGTGWITKGVTGYRLTAAALDGANVNEKGTYLLQLVAGQEGLVANHRAAAWMSAWSASDFDRAAIGAASATGSGVPGLEALRRILIDELRLKGRQKIQRSAAQLVIEIK